MNSPIRTTLDHPSSNTKSEEAHELDENLQDSYVEQNNANNNNHDPHYCFCGQHLFQRIWCLLIYMAAGVLNIVDSILIRIVNRFYYHNI